MGQGYKLRSNITLQSAYREECGHLLTIVREVSQYREPVPN